MYIPNLYRVDDFETLFAFMQTHNFALVISNTDGAPVATHLPLTVRVQDEQVIVRGHFAKANPQWQTFAGQDVLVVFSGPHAYISPRHYQQWESVPTWNYVAVHAYGQAELVTYEDSREQLQEIIEELIALHEPNYQLRWDDLSDRFREGMLRGVVGFELTVSRIEGKAKLSQNKHLAEQESISEELVKLKDTTAKALGIEMKKRIHGE
ncbi:MAG: FMN-binding negative transcriptional regulator [Aggregatilineales bacterium]